MRANHSLREEVDRLRKENEKLRRELSNLKQACPPSPELLELYEETWERAFSSNRYWVYESTLGGTFSVRRKTFRDLCKDDRALDDLIMLDKLFRSLAIAVNREAARKSDVAEWHKDLQELLKVWKHRYRHVDQLKKGA